MERVGLAGPEALQGLPTDPDHEVPQGAVSSGRFHSSELLFFLYDQQLFSLPKILVGFK